MACRKGKLYLLGAFSLAGTSVITGRFLTHTLGSFSITCISLGIVLLCLLPVFGARTTVAMRTLTRKDWGMLLAQAALGIFLFRAFLLFGVVLTSTVEAGLLTGTTPALTSMLAYLLLRERPTGTTVLGILCSVAGMLLMQGSHLAKAQFSPEHALGNALIVCAAASEALFNILSRKQKAYDRSQSAANLHPMSHILLVAALAFALSLIPAWRERPWRVFGTLGAAEWGALCWYGLVVTALAFFFFYEGVKRCDAHTTAAFSGVMPLTSMLLSLLLLGEPASAFQWIGGGLILLSMLLIGSAQSSLERQWRQVDLDLEQVALQLEGPEQKPAERPERSPSMVCCGTSTRDSAPPSSS